MNAEVRPPLNEILVGPSSKYGFDAIKPFSLFSFILPRPRQFVTFLNAFLDTTARSPLSNSTMAEFILPRAIKRHRFAYHSGRYFRHR